MSEFLESEKSENLTSPEQEQNPELVDAIGRLVMDCLPEDVEFVQDMDLEELLGYVYGVLLEQGEDPDALFLKYGITETKEGES